MQRKVLTLITMLTKTFLPVRQKGNILAKWMIFAGIDDLQSELSAIIILCEVLKNYINIFLYNIVINIYIILKYHTILDFFQGSPSLRPIPDVSQWDKKRKRDWLHDETTVFLTQIFGNTGTSQNVIDLEEAHRQGFHCRHGQCNMKFPLHSTRVRYKKVANACH